MAYEITNMVWFTGLNFEAGVPAGNILRGGGEQKIMIAFVCHKSGMCIFCLNC